VQIVPRFELPRLLNRAGLNAATREFTDEIATHRLTIRETVPVPYLSGPARKAVYPDGRVEGPYPLADRPLLSRFLAEAMAAAGATLVLATVPEGTFWLNNKTMAAYFGEVADAVRVSRFLRQRGLTDKFRGGFLLSPLHFAATLPLLAAQPYAGGADVQFTALHPTGLRLTAVACHHFDIHFASPDAALLDRLAALAPPALTAESLALPEVIGLFPA
jgi:hypothetical protein